MARVDARDVLDPDGRTARAFRGRIVGHYRRVGPDAWDDYRFVAEDGGEIDVLPGLKIQVERHGARFRMRRQGRVIRVEWSPSAADLDRMPEDNTTARRALFMAEHVQHFDEASGQPMAVIASKLED